MRAGFEAFAELLEPHFAALSAEIEAVILTELLKGEDAFLAYRFEIDRSSLRGLIALLQQHADLWTDFQQAVRDHRHATHWTKLIERVYELGNLQGKLILLEGELPRLPQAERVQLAEQLNCLDGEIGLCHDLADRRKLANRISQLAGLPLIDGLTLRGLTFVCGSSPELWQHLQQLIENPTPSVTDHGPVNNARP